MLRKAWIGAVALCLAGAFGSVALGDEPELRDEGWSHSLSVERLEEWIQKRNSDSDRSRWILTAEDLIQNLPRHMRQNYIIMVHSRSLQNATPKYPRIILRGKHDNTVLTFNTDPTSHAYRKIEIMEWKGHIARFVFSEIDFSEAIPVPSFSSDWPNQIQKVRDKADKADAVLLGQIKYDVEQSIAAFQNLKGPFGDFHAKASFEKGLRHAESAQSLISRLGESWSQVQQIALGLQARTGRPNVQIYRGDAGHPKTRICLECHGQDPRPSWEEGRLWPGQLPFHNDQLFAGTKEATWYKDLYRGIQSKDRLKHLKAPTESLLVLSQMEDGLIPGAPRTQFVDVEGLSRRDLIMFPSRGSGLNFELSLRQKNLSRIVRQLHLSPDFPKFKYALFAVLSGCINGQNPLEIRKYFPHEEAVRIETFFGKNPIALMFETERLAEKHLEDRITVQEQLLGREELERSFELLSAKPTEEAARVRVSSLRYVLEPFGIDVGQWSLSIDPKSYTFGVSGVSFFMDLKRALFGGFGFPLLGLVSEKLEGNSDVCDKILPRVSRLAFKDPKNAAKLMESRAGSDLPEENPTDCTPLPLNLGPLSPATLQVVDQVRAVAAHEYTLPESCQKCHGGDDPESGISLPFSKSQEGELRSAVRDRNFLDDVLSRIDPHLAGGLQMPPPPAEPLNESERTALRSYLERLAAEGGADASASR